jgi:hypothetical protein
MKTVGRPREQEIAGVVPVWPPAGHPCVTPSILTSVKGDVAGDVALAHQSVTGWVD